MLPIPGKNNGSGQCGHERSSSVGINIYIYIFKIQSTNLLTFTSKWRESLWPCSRIICTYLHLGFAQISPKPQLKASWEILNTNGVASNTALKWCLKRQRHDQHIIVSLQTLISLIMFNPLPLTLVSCDPRIIRMKPEGRLPLPEVRSPTKNHQPL